MKVKLIISLLLISICCGCLFMRYEFEKAINNLPPGSKLISVNNYTIIYKYNNVIYKSRYWPNGEIYKTEVIFQ